ncbi:hypothetical protein Btru_026752 [Bulinus truncatus]|nr:hypothetical protein Btru_026752 [Bulinus truncatus]
MSWSDSCPVERFVWGCRYKFYCEATCPADENCYVPCGDGRLGFKCLFRDLVATIPAIIQHSTNNRGSYFYHGSERKIIILTGRDSIRIDLQHEYNIRWMRIYTGDLHSLCRLKFDFLNNRMETVQILKRSNIVINHYIADINIVLKSHVQFIQLKTQLYFNLSLILISTDDFKITYQSFMTTISTFSPNSSMPDDSSHSQNTQKTTDTSQSSMTSMPPDTSQSIITSTPTYNSSTNASLFTENNYQMVTFSNNSQHAMKYEHGFVTGLAIGGVAMLITVVSIAVVYVHQKQRTVLLFKQRKDHVYNRATSLKDEMDDYKSFNSSVELNENINLSEINAASDFHNTEDIYNSIDEVI